MIVRAKPIAVSYSLTQAIGGLFDRLHTAEWDGWKMISEPMATETTSKAQGRMWKVTCTMEKDVEW